MINKGIIGINKPIGWTSFDVVNKLKSKFKPNKVGHLGTLDPIATGVLLVTVGKATRLFDLAQQKDKTYIAKFEFGYSTDTLDTTGKKISTSSTIPTKEQIQNCLSKLTGEIMQVPPKYSAKSVNGVRAYDLARNGIEFELKAKKVKIYELTIVDYTAPVLELKIKCSSGTYIRSICRDLADLLNANACMTGLIRTNIGNIGLERCMSIEEVTNCKEFEPFMIPLEDVIRIESLNLEENLTSKILNGQSVNIDKSDGNYFLKRGNDYLAVVNVKNFIGKMTIYLE